MADRAVDGLVGLGAEVQRAAEVFGQLAGLSLPELADRWEHQAGQMAPGVHAGRMAALRWLAVGEILADRVNGRRGEAAAAALMAGATVGEVAAALGLAGHGLPERSLRRVVRELVIGWARDADRAGVIAADQHQAVLDRLDAAG